MQKSFTVSDGLIPISPPSNLWRIGCVSYLNSKPLVHGLSEHSECQVLLDIPSRLVEQLKTQTVDIALCPIIDFFNSPHQLVVVPVGGICSASQTFTVRLFSQRPLNEITEVYTDTDSHTSVALLCVLMNSLFGLRPTIVPWSLSKQLPEKRAITEESAILLIGDKVVTHSPSDLVYPYQMDLGQAWNKLTGLPFVFASWLAIAGRDLGDLPKLLAHQLQENDAQRAEIAAYYAPLHQWPIDFAKRYLCHLLHYTIGPLEIQAIQKFGQMTFELGLTPESGPWQIQSIL